jgi:hypothetical protein
MVRVHSDGAITTPISAAVAFGYRTVLPAGEDSYHENAGTFTRIVQALRNRLEFHPPRTNLSTGLKFPFALGAKNMGSLALTRGIVPSIGYLYRIRLAGCLYQVGLSPQVALATVIAETNQDRLTGLGAYGGEAIAKALRPKVSGLVPPSWHCTPLHHRKPTSSLIKAVLYIIAHLWVRRASGCNMGGCVKPYDRPVRFDRKGDLLLAKSAGAYVGFRPIQFGTNRKYLFSGGFETDSGCSVLKPRQNRDIGLANRPDGQTGVSQLANPYPEAQPIVRTTLDQVR